MRKCPEQSPCYVKISSALGFEGYSEKSNNGSLNPCVFFNKNKATAKTESNTGDLPYGTRSFCLWSRATVLLGVPEERQTGEVPLSPMKIMTPSAEYLKDGQKLSS